MVRQEMAQNCGTIASRELGAILGGACDEAVRAGSTEIAPIHLVLAILKVDTDVRRRLRAAGTSPDVLRYRIRHHVSGPAIDVPYLEIRPSASVQRQLPALRRAAPGPPVRRAISRFWRTVLRDAVVIDAIRAAGADPAALVRAGGDS